MPITYVTLHTKGTKSSTEFEYFPPAQTSPYNADSNFNTKSQGYKTNIYNICVYQIVTYPTMLL